MFMDMFEIKALALSLILHASEHDMLMTLALYKRNTMYRVCLNTSMANMRALLSPWKNKTMEAIYPC